MNRSHLTILLLVLPALSIAGVAAAVEADARSSAMVSITSDEIKTLVAALADDTFEGREAGSRGNRAAGIYIIERLKKTGLHGGVENSGYYQRFGNYANILAFIEGGDPALKDQVIVAGAHYDHVGYGTSRNSNGPIGRIHNGADDNASGVAGLLEVAEAVAKLPERPRRSILFAFWDGEEKGLLGSQYWVEHPTVPLSRVSLAINTDMIGRLRKNRVEVHGIRTGAGLRQLISRQNDAAQLLLDFTWDIRPDSDHYSFVSKQIPFLMIFTGLHDDYHRPSDDAEKVNIDGLRQIAQLTFSLVVGLADEPSVPGFRRRSTSESRHDQRTSEAALPAQPGRLGIRWDDKVAAEGSIVIVAVTPGSAADKGGLRAGDRLTTFAGQEISDAQTLRQIVLAARNPVQATVSRARTADAVELTLQLAGDPVRLGITWRVDEAEPGCVILNRVTPGSAAEVAGLHVNDRIYRIGGRTFSDGEEFRQLATTLPGPLVLEVETNGRVRSAEVSLVEQP